MSEATPDYTKATRSLLIDASQDSIWNALTTSEALSKWQGDHAAIDLRVGGKYQFWGKHTYRAISEDGANQVITRLEPNRRLSYRWTIDDLDHLWHWNIEPEGSSCKVTVQVDLSGNLHSYPYWLTVDTIEVALLGLREFLGNGNAAPLPDYSEKEPGARLTITIDAAPGDVFAALTEPELMDKWVSEGAKVEPRAGGVYLYGWTEKIDGVEQPAGPTTLLAYEPGRLIRHDWHYSTEPKTVVEWLVEGVDGSTVVRLTHTGFLPESDSHSYRQGWMAFLYRLKAISENKSMTEKP